MMLTLHGLDIVSLHYGVRLLASSFLIRLIYSRLLDPKTRKADAVELDLYLQVASVIIV